MTGGDDCGLYGRGGGVVSGDRIAPTVGEWAAAVAVAFVYLVVLPWMTAS